MLSPLAACAAATRIAAVTPRAAAIRIAAATPIERAASYLLSREQRDGSFAEPGASSSAGLSAWVVLGLHAVGRAPADPEAVARYLDSTPTPETTDLELKLLAQRALGRDVSALAKTIDEATLPSGRIGPALNSTYWGMIALRAAGSRPGSATVGYVLHAQRKSGGWSWSRSASADAGDTAAAIEALRAAGTSARSSAVKRGIRYLRRCQNRDGGFAVSPGSPSDAQSTAWAIQALLAARTKPGQSAFRYLKKLQRPNGSFRYSRLYATTPVWVTAQVICALALRPFPL
jgi:hypothetical protein